MPENNDDSILKYRIDRIHVSGLKSIEKATISLNALNVFIGENGAGKSTFITALRLLHSIAVDESHRIFSGEDMDSDLDRLVATSGGAASLTRCGRKTRYRMTLVADCTVHGFRHYYEARLSRDPHDKLRVGPRFFFNPEHGTPTTDSTPFEVFDVLRGIRVYHLNDTSIFASSRRLCDAHDGQSLQSDASNIAAFICMLRDAHPRHYRRLVQVIRRVFPLFDDFDMAPDRVFPGNVRLEWRERGIGLPLTANEMSDGTLRFICLAALLMQPFDRPEAPRVIVIDEPELGLHPSAISLLVSMIEMASMHVQVVVATQSSTLVSALSNPDSVVVVKRNSRGSMYERLNSAELALWLEEYQLGNLWERGVLADGGVY